MRKPEYIDQLLPSYVRKDAIGNHVHHMQTLIQERGFESRIFAEMWSNETKNSCQHFFHLKKSRPSHNGILIYHFSVGSWIVNYLLGRKDLKVTCYHNITPPEFFADPKEIAPYLSCRQGLRQKNLLSILSQNVWTVSQYNAEDLRQSNFREPIFVFPVLRNYGHLTNLQKNAQLKVKLSTRKNLLFVGRLEVHKGITDLITLLKAYQEIYGKGVRLNLVGKTSPHYALKLNALCEKWQLKYQRLSSKKNEIQADTDIVYWGEISDEDLSTIYDSADVFVCMSDHEGFCVPLVEAMHFGLPILAHRSSAVSETLGSSAGVLVDKADFATVVNSLRGLLEDQERRGDFSRLARQRAAQEFGWDKMVAKFDRAFDYCLRTYAESGRLTGDPFSPTS